MQVMKPAVEAIPPSSDAISLLVAEDDMTVRILLKAIINKKFPGATVHLAENGRAGVDLFKLHQPEIVITDISMPVMDGIQMAREIRALRAAAKIIVISACDEAHYCEIFGQIGIEDFIVKPIMLVRLLAVIEKCLDEVPPAS
jgi:YesN/AraC family two-component response regulator